MSEMLALLPVRRRRIQFSGAFGQIGPQAVEAELARRGIQRAAEEMVVAPEAEYPEAPDRAVVVIPDREPVRDRYIPIRRAPEEIEPVPEEMYREPIGPPYPPPEEEKKFPKAALIIGLAAVGALVVFGGRRRGAAARRPRAARRRTVTEEFVESMRKFQPYEEAF